MPEFLTTKSLGQVSLQRFMTALALKFTRKSGEGHRGNWIGKAKRWERMMWTMRSHHWAVLNHWRLLGVWWAAKECVQICLLAQFLLHFIHPFNEYLLNTLSGPDTVQNAEDTMYLGLAWRQWFIVSSCLQFSLLWNFFFLLSNCHMLHNICYALCSRLCQTFCTITSSSSQQLYSIYLPILQMSKLAQKGKWFVKGHPLIDGIADSGTQTWII